MAGIVLQAILAMCSPLYYSNFWDPVYEYITGTWFDTTDSLFPCQLCWWARIMMFPIVPLSLIAFFSKSKAILWYIYAVTFPGIALEAFHYILQKPWIVGQLSIENPFGCTAQNPCAAVHVDYFGVLTIPFLCMLAFLVINIFTMLALFSKKIEKATK
jgi:disulfide bond formation protein DsbB